MQCFKNLPSNLLLKIRGDVILKNLVLARMLKFSGQWKHFFSPFFRDGCHRYLFSMKCFIPAGGNEFSDSKSFSFVQRFFLLVETTSDSSESQYLKRYHILTNVADVLVSGNHFSFSFLDSGQLLQMEAVYYTTRVSFSASQQIYLLTF